MPVPSNPTTATCIAQVPDTYQLQVLVDGAFAGSSPILCSVGTHGPRDGLNVRAVPLPTPGTRGLVAFVRGDSRSCVWVCSLDGPQVDALPGVPGLAGGNVHYEASWSGRWHQQSEGGQDATVWPDGSSLLVGYVVPPAVTRHTLNAQGARQAVPFSQAERVASPASPFNWTLDLASGASLSLGADGSVTARDAAGDSAILAGGTVTVTTAGGATAVLSGANATIMAGAGGTVMLTVQAGQKVVASAGGAVHPVALQGGGYSTVFEAE